LELPSEKNTWTVPPFAAGATTWLFVRMWPSSRITTPEPVPWALRPPSEPVTRSVTTLGVMAAAAASTVPGAVVFAEAGETSRVITGAAPLPSLSLSASVAAEPVTPETNANAIAPTAIPAAKRRRGGCWCGGIPAGGAVGIVAVLP
jgi:hypothetical protein